MHASKRIERCQPVTSSNTQKGISLYIYINTLTASFTIFHKVWCLIHDTNIQFWLNSSLVWPGGSSYGLLIAGSCRQDQEDKKIVNIATQPFASCDLRVSWGATIVCQRCMCSLSCHHLPSPIDVGVDSEESSLALKTEQWSLDCEC